jgi:ASC-1-like (ASCH) protein
LVILKPHYLHLVLQGTKTIECRLSRTRRLPFKAVRSGDTLWLKRSAGPIVAKARAGRVESIELDGAMSIKAVVSRYRDKLQIGAAFFRDRADARYLTLIRIEQVTRIPALRFEKRDRNAWVILPRSPRARS